MKKKVFIGVGLVILIGLLVCAYLFLFKKNIVSTITLDINPSVKINLDKKNKVVRVDALNEDAKKVVSKDMKGKSINDTIKMLVDNVKNNGFADDDKIEILMYTTGDINHGDVIESLHNSFGEIDAVVTVIEEVTKEDEELAKKYGISPSKAAFINQIKEEYKDVDVETLIDKSTNEIKEIKNVGKICDDGYVLEGNWCLKEVNRKPAQKGDVCPNNYYEVNGKCYHEEPIVFTDKYECPESDQRLEGNKCYRTREVEAKANFKCDKGTLVKRDMAANRDVRDDGDPNEYLCEDNTGASKPTLRCLSNPGHIMIGGSCYNGPAPLINGGCPGADKPINGGCYSKDDEDQWLCPNGDIYEKSKDYFPEYCPDTLTYTKASGNYTCEEGATLSGTKCTKEESMDAFIVSECPNGYSKVNNDRCINYNLQKDKEDGYYCEDENYRLKRQECILYEEVEPKEIK